MSKTVIGRVALTPKGEYVSSTKYQRLDLINYNGNSFIVLKEVIGVEPTNDGINYQLSASKGKGEAGPAGKDATINGVNALTITQGDNITITQEGSNMTISSTASGGSGVGKPGVGENSVIMNDLTTNKANGPFGFVEGTENEDNGMGNHMEGHGNYADMDSALNHIENGSNQALGYASYSHISGTKNKVTDAVACNVSGEGLTTNSNCQNVRGRYNILDEANQDTQEGRYVDIVGNGTKALASNAYTLDWDGNVWFKGNIKSGGTSYDDGTPIGAGTPGPAGPTGNSGVYRGTEEPTDPEVNVWLNPDGVAPAYATEEYVNNKVDGITTPIATTAVAGKVKPDGTTITVDVDGTIHGASGGGSFELKVDPIVFSVENGVLKNIPLLNNDIACYANYSVFKDIDARLRKLEGIDNGAGWG